jgi:hypothetical protein
MCLAGIGVALVLALLLVVVVTVMLVLVLLNKCKGDGGMFTNVAVVCVAAAAPLLSLLPLQANRQKP